MTGENGRGAGVAVPPAEETVPETVEAVVAVAPAAAPVAEEGYMYFGEYPQTIKAADVTVGDTVDDRGYYLGSDGCYYVKAQARCEDKDLSDGTLTVSGFEYYFKVEPLKWRMLSKKPDGTALLLAESILPHMEIQKDSREGRDSRYNLQHYTSANGAPRGTFANNYVYSGVRAWLNGEFLRQAFTEEEQKLIAVTSVDNGLKSTGDEKNPHVCPNTEGKAFLLSVEEATSPAYGFSDSTGESRTRQKKCSDFTLDTGGGESWWLRSPSRCCSDDMYCVQKRGNINSMMVNIAFCGVVPALQIRL